MSHALSRRTLLCTGSGDLAARQALTQTLDEYELVFAASGFEAISNMNAQAFDGYITNYWLPDWAGAQLCRSVRQTDPHCPIVVYSAASRAVHVGRALRAGASACVAVDEPDLLQSTVRRLLAAADSRSLDAKALMEEAVDAELARCAEAAGAAQLAERFIERRARTRAYEAFVAGGGCRARFDRWWPQVFGSARANARVAFA